jgi:predicted negative regulator of RcsB-dependent stress response
MAMANLKIGNLYDVKGRRDAAKEQYTKVLEMKGYQNSHELARRYLQDPFRP